MASVLVLPFYAKCSDHFLFCLFDQQTSLSGGHVVSSLLLYGLKLALLSGLLLMGSRRQGRARQEHLFRLRFLTILAHRQSEIGQMSLCC